MLREWRQRRRLTQLDLAVDAGISSKHLSFLETGRAAASRDMLLHLAETLEVPLRERNALLFAGGYAPIYPERQLGDPALSPARAAIDLVLAGHEPYPAVAVDRHWNLVAANRTVPALLAGAAPEVLKPPINVLRLSLHPNGLAPRILNLREWREHLLSRLRAQLAITADPVLKALYDELAGYPEPAGKSATDGADAYAGFVVPLRFESAYGRLSLFSTMTVFGSPLDVTLSELAIESFFPADAETAERLRRIHAEAQSGKTH